MTESSLSESKPELDSNSPIWELWDRLTEYYGSAFVSQYGDEPTATWAFTLRELTPDDYRKGFELLAKRESSFPPNPGEFLQMIANDNSWERQCHKVYTNLPALEDQTAKARRKADGLDMIRKLRGEVGL